MRINFMLLTFSVVFTISSCSEDKEGMDPDLARASCGTYCEKRFDCGVTIPTDQPTEYYLEFCKEDCFDQLVDNSSAELFEMPSNCCVIDCDTSLSCGDWASCCNDC